MADADQPSIDDELAAIAAVAATGDLDAAHRRAVALADTYRDDRRAQVAAAGACDRLGRAREAVGYYAAAWQLGGPVGAARPGFLLGYGAALRAVGRHDDSIAILGQAALEHPDHAALRAFLALSLHAAGHATLALATMLDAGLDAAPQAFAPHRRELTRCLRELQDVAMADPAQPA